MGKSYWKFNTSVLSDRALRLESLAFCHSYIVGDITLEWLDCFQEKIKLFIGYCKRKSKINRAVFKRLCYEYKELVIAENIDPGNYTEQLIV